MDSKAVVVNDPNANEKTAVSLADCDTATASTSFTATTSFSAEDSSSRSSCSRHRLLDGNPEAIAWTLDVVVSGIVLVGSGAFLITALLKLATDAAGCETERLPGESKIRECNNTVHGMKPSSLITVYATAIGLAAALIMPVVGAIVDKTPYRRGIGRLLAGLFCSLIFPTIFVSEDTWFAVSIVFAVSVFIGWFQAMVLYAYLPELSSDKAVVNKYTRTFSIASFGSMLLYLVLIVGISAALGYTSDTDTLDDEIATARLSQSVSFVLAVIFFSIAWGWLFKPRQPPRPLQEGESILTSGFRQIYSTAVKVHRHYPALKWFFVAIALCDAATSALLVLALTYLTEVVEFSGSQNATAAIVLLVSSIPGCLLSSWWTHRFNPVRSSMMAVTILTINTALVAGILRGPDQELAAYLFAIGWGIGVGWKWPCDRMLFAVILPPGQNAEFSGAYVFFRQCLSWLPPLVFSIMNESGVSLRWGMASLDIFFILGLLTYYFGMGTYTTAEAETFCTEVAMVERHDEEATSKTTIVCPDDEQGPLAGAVAEESSDET